jgi:hypothetical protein
MFSPIAIDEFVKKHVRGNPGESAADLRVSLEDVVKRKLAGGKCSCGQPIWAIGSAIAGMAQCFTCTPASATVRMIMKSTACVFNTL